MLPWSVSAVTCMAACPDGSVFAAGYEDGKVEVFDAVVYNRLAVSTLKLLCIEPQPAKRQHTLQGWPGSSCAC